MTALFVRSDYEVRSVAPVVARAMIKSEHYARGASTTGVAIHGLFPTGSKECLGVAWWLPPTKVAAQSVWEKWQAVLCLSRLVVMPHVPTNGASFLIAKSIRLVRRDSRWECLLTYADTGEGHTGAIYRATNWEYLGLRKGAPRWIEPISGRMVAAKATRTRTKAEMLALGYVIAGRFDKHKFRYVL